MNYFQTRKNKTGEENRGGRYERRGGEGSNRSEVDDWKDKGKVTQE